MNDLTRAKDKELVTRARKLERLLSKRRKIAADWAMIDHEIKTERRMINELTRPDAVERGELPASDAARVGQEG